jgi:hypothetical protein
MIDKIINEWTYQLDAGYPTKESDYEILRSVLTETNMLSEQEIDNTVRQAQGKFEADQDTNRIGSNSVFKGGSPDYDAAIRSRLGLDPDDPIPQVTQNYILDAGPINLDPEDAKIVRILWPENLNSSIIGKGEVSIYWLYQYQNPPKRTIDLRGDDNPDLNIAGSNVEVKSYNSHKERISLGRFGKFKESIRMISILFGIQTLTNLFTEDRKVYSLNSFNSKDLIASFDSLQSLDSIQGKQELMVQFPIFKTMYDQITELKSQLNLQDGYTAIEGAAAIMRRLLFEKFKIKPGNNGYIINLTPKDPSDIYAFEVDLESIDDETMLANVTINGASIEVNYNALFGKG